MASAGLQSAAGVMMQKILILMNLAIWSHPEQPQCCPHSNIGGLHCLSSLVSFPYLFSWPIRDGGVILGNDARVMFLTY
ncbi:uncharacterized protein J3R85_000730 [Psidium guajava]|nr:uncharacterized protein J3R85_000730 [Psidium guajava]